MIHQLICENQQPHDRAVLAVTLRTTGSAGTGRVRGTEPTSTSTTAYYVVAKDLASKLVGTQTFYSSDPADEDQISFALSGKVPDVVRRRSQTGRLGFTPAPEELESDLRAVFGKYGGPMPVYKFVCD